MHIKFRPGFSVYRNKHIDPTYVTPHSGAALETPTSRDDNSETVASLCWMKTGGSLIISNISRKRGFGIDFNRDVPPKKLSIDIFEDFLNDRNQKKLHEFRKRYAFSASNQKDYEFRLKIYNEFWKEVKRGSFIILVHRAFSRLKAVPSIMDIVTFDSLGINKNFMKSVVRDINKNHADFLKSIERAYKSVVFLEEERAIKNILRIYKNLGIGRINIEFLENLKKDLNIIKRYLGEKALDDLMKNFTVTNFMKTVKKTLKVAEHPKVTVEHIFVGEKATGPKKQLLPGKRLVIEIEPTSFISFWYPQKASEIITEIIYNITERLSH